MSPTLITILRIAHYLIWGFIAIGYIRQAYYLYKAIRSGDKRQIIGQALWLVGICIALALYLCFFPIRA